MSGLLDLLMSGFPVKPKTPPQVTQNTIEVTLTADELKALYLAGQTRGIRA